MDGQTKAKTRGGTCQFVMKRWPCIWIWNSARELISNMRELPSPAGHYKLRPCDRVPSDRETKRPTVVLIVNCTNPDYSWCICHCGVLRSFVWFVVRLLRSGLARGQLTTATRSARINCHDFPPSLSYLFIPVPRVESTSSSSMESFCCNSLYKLLLVIVAAAAAANLTNLHNIDAAMQLHQRQRPHIRQPECR